MLIDVDAHMAPETSKFSPLPKANEERASMPPSPDASEKIPAPAQRCTITNDLCNFDLQAGVSLIYPTNEDKVYEDLVEPSSKRSHPFNMTGQFGGTMNEIHQLTKIQSRHINIYVLGICNFATMHCI